MKKFPERGVVLIKLSYNLVPIGGREGGIASFTSIDEVKLFTSKLFGTIHLVRVKVEGKSFLLYQLHKDRNVM